MELKIYQVDAFTDKVFEGNPAAVCPLNEWIDDDLMQKIAEENNLSETAFFVDEGQSIALRWFTPKAEIDLCGHATLAAAHVLFKHLNYSKQVISFTTKSGLLEVSQTNTDYQLSFPATMPLEIKAPEPLLEALCVESASVLAAFDYVVVLKSQQDVQNIKPDFDQLKTLDLRGVIVTALGDSVDFVSRCFFPKYGVDEDPVTGSAHCELTPFWAKQLNKNKLTAKQLSKRTGLVGCELIGDKVLLTGKAVDYMFGSIFIES
ncbi:MAG: PhzF family phenazine biosynthesis protein [Saccharospirillaceae bacterium]|nr:PhzF family phenazine biosynthesis protein [Pseudomonadales bacterium]NRB79822.1 PhzF family phenazine biosynthesis protein [Saccharospirillaceae bacterium]